MTDREAMITVFKAVAALAEKLTGQRMAFEQTLANGNVVRISSESIGDVSWRPITDDEVDLSGPGQLNVLSETGH
jgi:hypothetical protein